MKYLLPFLHVKIASVFTWIYKLYSTTGILDNSMYVNEWNSITACTYFGGCLVLRLMSVSFRVVLCIQTGRWCIFRKLRRLPHVYTNIKRHAHLRRRNKWTQNDLGWSRLQCLGARSWPLPALWVMPETPPNSGVN